MEFQPPNGQYFQGRVSIIIDLTEENFAEKKLQKKTGAKIIVV